MRDTRSANGAVCVTLKSPISSNAYNDGMGDSFVVLSLRLGLQRHPIVPLVGIHLLDSIAESGAVHLVDVLT